MADVQSSYDSGTEGGSPRRPVGLLGLIVLLLLIIILLLALLLRGCDDSGGGSTATVEVTREVTQEVTRLVTPEGGGAVAEVTRLVTQEVPGPTVEVTRLVTEVVTVPGEEVTRIVTREVPVTTVVTETVEIPRIVTRVVVIPPPPPQDTGDGCTRFNLETGRNRETGTPGAGTFVMVQEPFDRDENVIAVWHAAAGARDSGWLRDLPLAREAVHVQVTFYPDDYGTPVLLEVVNPAPGTTYGWLARGICHAIEVQFPESG